MMDNEIVENFIVDPAKEPSLHDLANLEQLSFQFTQKGKLRKYKVTPKDGHVLEFFRFVQRIYEAQKGHYLPWKYINQKDKTLIPNVDIDPPRSKPADAVQMELDLQPGKVARKFMSLKNENSN